MFCPELILQSIVKLNEARLQKTARSAVFSFTAPAAKFQNREINKLVGESIFGVLSQFFWLLNSFQKLVLYSTQEFTHC